MTLEEFVAQLTPDSDFEHRMPAAFSTTTNSNIYLAYEQYVAPKKEEFWSLLTVEEQLYFALLILEAEGR